MKNNIIFLVTLALMAMPVPAVAQEFASEDHDIFRAEVVEVIEEEIEQVPGLSVSATYQILNIRLLDGPFPGEIMRIENDYIPLSEGDKVYITRDKQFDGTISYSVTEPDRQTPLLWLTAFFITALVALARWKGVRAAISLAVGFLTIIFVLIPWLLSGAPPVLVALAVTIPLLGAVMLITHGFSRMTAAAFLGTVGTLVGAGALAAFSIWLVNLSGFSSHESTYLNVATSGALDISGLLLAGILVGMIGVLDDIAVTQSAVVLELRSHGASRKEAFTSALRIGQEHVGALVNTLAFAYAGAALPLLLLFAVSSDMPIGLLLSHEVIATEIVRTLVGSIGLIATVPFATIAALLLEKRPSQG